MCAVYRVCTRCQSQHNPKDANIANTVRVNEKHIQMDHEIKGKKRNEPSQNDDRCSVSFSYKRRSQQQQQQLLETMEKYMVEE